MKFNFKKIASTIASAVMLSSTVGFAAAASWPAPFVTDGVADVAVVYPSADAAAGSDAAGAVTIQNALGAFVTDDDTPTYSGDGWTVGENSNNELELNESLTQIETSIDNDYLDILAPGSITNEKGTANYEQEFTFDTDTASSLVKYTEDTDDNPGLYYYVASGNPIMTYSVDFTTSLKSDITSSTNDLQDISDKTISLLGKEYTITSAVNGSDGVELTLMSGADKTTLANGEVVTVDGRQVSVLVSASDEAKFTVDGEESDKLSSGDAFKFLNGAYIGVTDVTYQSYAGGLAQATFFLGGDKLELKHGQEVSVDSEDISGTLVSITSTEASGDITITALSIQMNASGGDDITVPIGEKLSDYVEEPGILFGNNWDIIFEGIEDVDYEKITLDPSSDDKEYVLKLETTTSEDEFSFPVLFANTTGIFSGEKTAKPFVLDPTTSLTRYSYFVLASGDASSAAADVDSCIVQYLGADYNANDAEEVIFKVLGQTDDVKKTYDGATGTTSFSVKLCKQTYTFANASAANTDNYDIVLTDASTNWVSTNNNVTSVLIRTKYNTLINITDTMINSTGVSYPWTISLVLDDDSRDGDNYPLTTPRTIYSASIDNGAVTTDELATTVTAGTGDTWIDNPDDDDQLLYTTIYGAEITQTTSTSSEEKLEVMVPKSYVKPIVKIVEGEVQISSGSSGNGVMYVTDAQVNSVASKNLIVVGGSCINTVAANLLGSAGTPLCTEAFTAKTTVGVGEYLIEVFDSPYDDGDKIAMLVAGYEATDTTRAANAVAEGIDDDIAIGTKVVSDIVG